MKFKPRGVYESPNGTVWEYIGKTNASTPKPHVFRGVNTGMLIYTDDKGNSERGPLFKEGDK